jgi:hypothetical protein
MKRGKKICKTLKEIRLQVAKANDIPYEPTECKHKGDCAGTCPKCEEEVRYIEQQLNIRRMLGKAVAVAGVSAGLAALTACNGPIRNILLPDVRGKMTTRDYVDSTKHQTDNEGKDPSMTKPDTIFELEGDVAAPEPDSKTGLGEE